MWGAIIAGVGMLMDGLSSRSAAKSEISLSQTNANLVLDESREEQRRLSADIRSSEGLMGAMSAASGVQMSGSRKVASTNIKRENRAQLDWLKKSGRQKYDVVRRGGQLQASQLQSRAQSQSVQGFGKIAQGIYSNYNTPSTGG